MPKSKCLRPQKVLWRHLTKMWAEKRSDFGK